jgi:hypothetical protein
MTRADFQTRCGDDVASVGVWYRTPAGLRYRTLSDSAADRVYRIARNAGFKHGKQLISRTDVQTHHREILIKPLTD